MIKVGVVEASMGGARENWHLIETLPLAVSGSTSTHREATILSLVSRRQSTGARSLDDDDLNLIAGSEDEDDTIDKPADDVRIRVRLCLRSSQTTCGDYTEAESKCYIHTEHFGQSWIIVLDKKFIEYTIK